ncbi:MAG: hypothetical protein M3Y27_25745 [Acidobacteriota bacterium]|nr:hypothetical protein [Acidobacteriota bacterium]
MVEEDAEIGPVLAGVALVGRAVDGKALKPATAFDVSRDVLVRLNRLSVAKLQHLLDVLIPIVRVPWRDVTWHKLLAVVT